MKIRYQLEPRPLEQKKRWQTEHKGISTRSPRTGPGFTRDPDALGKAKWPGEHVGIPFALEVLHLPQSEVA